MPFAPQQDWDAYRSLTADEDAAWLASLTVGERFALVADMFNLAWQARQNNAQVDWEAIDHWRWDQKLAQRLRFVEAHRKIDETRNARAPAANPD